MKIHSRTRIRAVAAAVACLLSAPTMAADKASYLRPSEAPAPADNQLTPARIELGRALFFDPRLSGSKWISCATCHNPALGWSDGLPTAIGHEMNKLDRATPTILNTAYNAWQFWDGRTKSLEEQALEPISAPGEMSQNLDILVKELAKISDYVALFDRAYPGEGITKPAIGKAIASYERTIVSTEAPFDKWIKGDRSAISPSAKNGFTLFESKANCAACHQGFNFQDDGFHNIGLKTMDGVEEDVGRFAKKPIKVLKGAFKTPTLRDIALTAPYMHNGVYGTLTEVIDHYNVGGINRDNIDPNIKPLNLSHQEKADLLAFLKSLTGEAMVVTIPRLPQ